MLLNLRRYTDEEMAGFGPLPLMSLLKRAGEVLPCEAGLTTRDRSAIVSLAICPPGNPAYTDETLEKMSLMPCLQPTHSRWEKWFRGIVAIAGFFAAFALVACGTGPRTAYTESDAAAPAIAGIRDASIFADAPAASFREEARAVAASASHVRTPPTYLALSGGGADGAFGAGVLNGWTAAGTRPEFTIVSGVSAGALIAPFAFLGPSYDDKLREVYTSGLAASLLGSPNIFNAIFGSSLYGNARLRDLIARYADARLVAAVAAEHAKGRRLFVVTTNLNSQRAVMWDMGRIASSGSPQALDLFRDVLAASASIPGVFPPMLIDAEANGKRFQEMHVDGGVMTPVFTMPDAFLLGSAALPRGAPLNIYILMNNKVAPDFEVVPNRTVEVALKAGSAAGKAETRSVLFETFSFTQRNGFGFNLTFIDQDAPSSTAVGFDTAYMQALYRYGFEKARGGNLWTRKLPSETPTVTRSGGTS